MYANMPPWWYSPPTSNQEMTPKDFLEFIKMFDEWKQSQKPKEEKKPDTSNKWTTGDYFVFICAFHSITIIMATTLILYNLTQFMKAIPHP